MTKSFVSGFFAFVILCMAVNVFAQRASRFRSGSEVRGDEDSDAPQKTPSPKLSKSLKEYKKKYNVVEEDGKKVLYKKQNSVDFDDSLIEGEIRNPSDFYFVHRPEEKFGSLLQKRKNF